MGNSSVESQCLRAPSRNDAFRITVRRFVSDNSGSHAIMAALLMPVLVGATAYGVETATLLHKQKSMQHAADSAALTAAVAVTTGANDNGAVQGRAVAASYGF